MITENQYFSNSKASRKTQPSTALYSQSLFLYYSKFFFQSSEFENSIYEIEWSFVSPKGWKNILFIGQRASKHIFITCSFFFDLSLESFLKVWKDHMPSNFILLTFEKILWKLYCYRLWNFLIRYSILLCIHPTNSFNYLLQ